MTRRVSAGERNRPGTAGRSGTARAPSSSGPGSGPGHLPKGLPLTIAGVEDGGTGGEPATPSDHSAAGAACQAGARPSRRPFKRAKEDRMGLGPFRRPLDRRGVPRPDRDGGHSSLEVLTTVAVPRRRASATQRHRDDSPRDRRGGRRSDPDATGAASGAASPRQTAAPSPERRFRSGCGTGRHRRTGRCPPAHRGSKSTRPQGHGG